MSGLNHSPNVHTCVVYYLSLSLSLFLLLSFSFLSWCGSRRAIASGDDETSASSTAQPPAVVRPPPSGQKKRRSGIAPVALSLHQAKIATAIDAKKRGEKYDLPTPVGTSDSMDTPQPSSTKQSGAAKQPRSGVAARLAVRRESLQRKAKEQEQRLSEQPVAQSRRVSSCRRVRTASVNEALAAAAARAAAPPLATTTTATTLTETGQSRQVRDRQQGRLSSRGAHQRILHNSRAKSKNKKRQRKRKKQKTQHSVEGWVVRESSPFPVALPVASKTRKVRRDWAPAPSGGLGSALRQYRLSEQDTLLKVCAARGGHERV